MLYYLNNFWLTNAPSILITNICPDCHKLCQSLIPWITMSTSDLPNMSSITFINESPSSVSCKQTFIGICNDHFFPVTLLALCVCFSIFLRILSQESRSIAYPFFDGPSWTNALQIIVLSLALNLWNEPRISSKWSLLFHTDLLNHEQYSWKLSYHPGYFLQTYWEIPGWRIALQFTGLMITLFPDNLFWKMLSLTSLIMS